MRVSTRATHAIPAVFCLALLGVTAARAQEQAQDQFPTLLPPVTVRPPLQPLGPGGINPGSGNGVGTNDKKGDKADGKAFEQLNHDLKRKVDEVNPTTNTPPLDARSPDTKIGVINIPGVQQQYGKNFGQSVIPYRPAPPVYSAPLGHR